MASILCKNLNKKFIDGKLAIDNLDIEILDKQIVTIVGCKGSGKTSLLKLLSGVEKPTNGEILIDGKNLYEIVLKDRDFLMVLDDCALNKHNTIYENLVYPLRLRKKSNQFINEKINSVAKKLEIENILDYKTKDISDYQLAKIKIARILIREAKVIFIDNPFCGLDKDLRHELFVFMAKALSNLNTTIIYTTDNKDEAITLGDEIILLNYGFVNQVGNREDFTKTPQNVFALNYFTDYKCNLIYGKLILDKSLLIKSKDFIVKLPKDFIENEFLKTYLNQEILIGFGTDAFEFNKNQFYKYDNIISGNLKFIEFYNNKKYLHINTGKNVIISEVLNNCGFKINEEIKVAIKMDKIFLFDKDNENSII